MPTADHVPRRPSTDTGADHGGAVIGVGAGSPRSRTGRPHPRLTMHGGRHAGGAWVARGSGPGAPEHLWRFAPRGARRIQNLASGLVLGVQPGPPGEGVLVVAHGDPGTADHLWTAIVDTTGYLRLRNARTGWVLGVATAGSANGARVGQWPDTGAAEQRWRLRHDPDGYFRIQCVGGGRVLAVPAGSTGPGAPVVIWDDDGADHQRWRFV